MRQQKILPNQCHGKTKYPNRQKAVSAAASMSIKKSDILKAYHCSECNGWHFGHQTKKVKMSPSIRVLKMRK